MDRGGCLIQEGQIRLDSFGQSSTPKQPPFPIDMASCKGRGSCVRHPTSPSLLYALPSAKVYVGKGDRLARVGGGRASKTLDFAFSPLPLDDV